jgi:hypothetical protein
MADQKRISKAANRGGPVESARSALRLVEIGLDLTLAAVLLVAVLIIGGEVLHEIVVGLQSGSIEAALKILDRVLLLFIIAELIYTLRISLARSQLILEPFLIIGLVAERIHKLQDCGCASPSSLVIFHGKKETRNKIMCMRYELSFGLSGATKNKFTATHDPSRWKYLGADGG